MKRLMVCGVFCLGMIAIAERRVQAHFLWVAIDAKSGSNGRTNVYFEHGPAPGDGHYLDPFIKRGRTWLRTTDAEKPIELEMAVVEQPGKRWLSAALPHAGPRSIDSFGTFGVYAYGKTNVLLHYYARHLDVATRDELHQLASAPQMQLDVVPRYDGSNVEATVSWHGQPVAKRTVTVGGPKRFFEKLTTDDAGKVRITPKAGGAYRFHVFVEEDKGGTFEDMDYELIRHHATLIVNLPLEK
mgnify:CR=1 FL=1